MNKTCQGFLVFHNYVSEAWDFVCVGGGGEQQGIVGVQIVLPRSPVRV